MPHRGDCCLDKPFYAMCNICSTELTMSSSTMSRGVRPMASVIYGTCGVFFCRCSTCDMPSSVSTEQDLERNVQSFMKTHLKVHTEEDRVQTFNLISSVYDGVLLQQLKNALGLDESLPSKTIQEPLWWKLNFEFPALMCSEFMGIMHTQAFNDANMYAGLMEGVVNFTSSKTVYEALTTVHHRSYDMVLTDVLASISTISKTLGDDVEKWKEPERMDIEYEAKDSLASIEELTILYHDSKLTLVNATK